jgi:trypsin-like peptidase
MASPEDITVALSAAKDGNPAGAGWLLPDGRIISCAHVVSARPAFWARYGGGEAREYRVAALLPVAVTDPPIQVYDGDLALLKAAAEDQGLKPGACLLPDFPRQGEEIVAHGYPSGTPGGARGQSGYGRLGTSTAAGRREVLDPGNPAHVLVQGFSGAPVVSAASGMVVGIFESTRKAAGRGNVIPVQQISEWLETERQDATFVDPGEEWPTRRVEDIQSAVFGQAVPKEEYDLRIRAGPPVSGAGTKSTRGDADYQPVDEQPIRLVPRVSRAGAQTLIYGDGGSGKSSYLVQLAAALERARQDFVWLNLKELKHSGTRDGAPDLASLLDGDLDEAMAWICNRVSASTIPPDFHAPAKHIVIIADGLNEVGREATRLLATLERFVRTRDKLSLLATARTTTALNPDPRTDSYVMRPISDDEIARVTRQATAELDDGFLAMLAVPQILGIAMRTGSFEIARRVDVFRQYFLLAIAKAFDDPKKGPDSEAPAAVLEALSFHSYEMLRHGATLVVQEQEWLERLDRAMRARGITLSAKTLTDELAAQGLLARSTGGDAPTAIGWQHSLYAEWLAARYLISLGSPAWRHAGFTAISLEDSSDDGLRLALEQVDETEVDLFLLHMYDWRWQRVLAFAAEGVDGLSPQLRDAFVGLNALRLLDHFQHTRDAVEPPLHRMAAAGNGFARELIDKAKSGSEAEVLALVRARFAGESFNGSAAKSLETWSRLLNMPSPVGEPGVETLVGIDPFAGWAASNILRLTQLGDDSVASLFAAYLASVTTAGSMSFEGTPGFHPSETGVGLRWRIVHALGRAVPEEKLDRTIEFLLNVWGGSDHPDVRFGACRSLLEIALAHPERRGFILDAFRQHLAGWRRGPADATWKRASAKAAEQLWRAWRPAAGILDAGSEIAWKSSLREVLEEAKVTAVALEWRTDGLDAALTALKPSQQEGEADGG